MDEICTNFRTQMSSDKKESPTKSNIDKDDPPTKAERQKCYGSRDLHWKCLDENGEDEENCKETRKVYAASCPEKWVS